MKVLITGATGFIGQRLTNHLLGKGFDVNIISRKKPEYPSFKQPGLSVFLGDITDHAVLERAMEGCVCAFHLAACTSVWVPDPTLYYRVNFDTTKMLFQTALRKGVEKIVFTSSASTLLCQSNEKPAYYSHYQHSKHLAERCVDEFTKVGLDIVVLHPTKVYGPGPWSSGNAITYLIKSFLEGDVHLLPDKNIVANFCFIDDVVNGHYQAWQKGKSGEHYILGGENSNFPEVFQILKDATDKRYFTIDVPFSLMMLYALKEEYANKIFRTPPKVTREWIRKWKAMGPLSSTKAIDEIGYRITPLEEGIRKTIQWLEEDQHVYF